MTAPITDRAERCADYGMSVPAETCRDLERVANQLYKQLSLSTPLLPKWPDVLIANNNKAIAVYEAMKKGTT